jgi:SAM-dependent methyltransferase
MNCRHCSTPLTVQFADLGSAPPSNAYLTAATLRRPERWFPLRIWVCTECWLVQTEDYAGADELFTDDYAYFSSYSKAWLTHSERYVDAVVNRFHLGSESLAVELAANDGYLLQFITSRGIPCIGVEPTASTAESARKKGVEIIQDFFGVRLAHEMCRRSLGADLIVANNVLAHVPNINDFVAGIAILLKAEGVATFEFPHFLNLSVNNQFDTIYHEHYSYLSLTSVSLILEKNGFSVFDVEEISTHGGSLRVYAQHRSGPQPRGRNVESLLQREQAVGLTTAAYYSGFQDRANKAKNCFLYFLLDAQQKGKKVAGYGAAAKGNTLLNYAGIHGDLIPYVVDANPAKRGKFLPGSRIPILSEDRIRQDRPDYIVVLPWNICDEIMADLAYVREWGARFVTAIPELRVL